MDGKPAGLYNSESEARAHTELFDLPPPFFFFVPSRPRREGDDGTVWRRVLRQRQADERWGDGVSGLNNVLK